ncbi:MAG TPA: hypothetical protein VKW77_11285, partial [Acidimicrobiales bacterium]|nr:hypothetical protein [Acidimicrobiales bacterium]
PTTLNTRERDRLLATVLSRMPEPDLRAGLERLGSRTDLPRVVVNAANALRRSRGLTEAVGRPPYRAVLPFLAASAAEPCLSETVDELGDASDDPRHEQLEAALETVRSSFPDSTIAVMLASVATEDMPASAVCLDILRTDERYGMTGWWSGGEPGQDQPSDEAPRGEQGDGTTTGGGTEDHDEGAEGELTGPSMSDGPEGVPEVQRAARRERRRTAADERRRRQDAARRAAEELRRKRREDRSRQSRRPPPGPVPVSPTDERRPPGRRPAPTLFRRPRLSAAELRAFDPDDPLVGSVVYLFVPFADAADAADEGRGEGEATDDGDSGSSGRATGGTLGDAGGAGGEPAAGGDRDGEPGGENDVDTADSGQTGDEVTGESEAELPEGKLRPCVVVGVATGELLVRAGYSAGGRKSRDWTSVELRDWRKAGLDQPTWIGAETVRLPRPELTTPPRRLSVDDWNALW